MILTKTQFETDDGISISGIKITIAPKLSKFFAIEIGDNSDNLMLLKTFNEVIYNWYIDSNINDKEDWHAFIENSYNKKND